eukprot:INCI4795.1.p1 GENE.INCI4795.1~~INCI4795.1.p1  ORF type:complete len:602 (-),score=79.17 INCI4795.1:536-2341(-)
MPSERPHPRKWIDYRNQARKFTILRWRARQECACGVAGGLHSVPSNGGCDRVVLSGFQAFTQLKETNKTAKYSYTTTINCTRSGLHFKVQCNSFGSEWSVTDPDMNTAMNKFLSHVRTHITLSKKTRKSAFLLFGLNGKSIATNDTSTSIHEPLEVQQQMKTKEKLAAQWTVENAFEVLLLTLGPILQRASPGRPSEIERRFSQHLLTCFVGHEAVDGRFLKFIAGGKVGRWEERLVCARARHRANELVEKSLRKYWTIPKRRKDAMPDAICIAAKQFWISDAVSRQLPANVNKDRKDGQPRFALCLPPEKAHALFVQSQQQGVDGNPDFGCSLEWFRQQRPSNVLNIKRQYALCTYHLRDFHAIDALYRWLRAAHTPRKGFGKTTPARCARKCMDTFSNLEAFLEQLYCPREKVWLNPNAQQVALMRPECRHGTCVRCPKLLDCPFVDSALKDEDVTIQFMKFETQQDIITTSGSTRSRSTFVAAQTSLEQIKSFCFSERYLKHRFVSRWQNHAFSTMQKIPPMETALIVIDFSMNWAGEGAMDPSQSFFNPLLITLVPVVVTMKRKRLRDGVFEKDLNKTRLLEQNDTYMIKNIHLRSV